MDWNTALQKKGNGKACLTIDQIASLEAIGMVWELEKRIPWDVYYKHAISYYKENGNLLTQSALRTEDGLWLGNWVTEQRKRYKQGKLRQERIEKLEAIDMVWEVVKRPPWPQWYEKAQIFYKEHGHLRVPKDYITPDGWALGDWISTQRCRYLGQLAPLTGEQTNALEKIGMQWRVFQERWEYMFALAEEYANEHGKLNIPRTYIHPNGEKLGQWIHVQRQAYAGNGMYCPLGNEKIKALESISMVWEYKKDYWGYMFSLAREYAKEHGRNIGNPCTAWQRNISKSMAICAFPMVMLIPAEKA